LSNFYCSSAEGASIWNFFLEGKLGFMNIAGPTEAFTFILVASEVRAITGVALASGSLAF
jgi:hypothetical protein